MLNKKINIIKREKGAITVYVILSVVFLAVLIIGTYIIANRKLQAQYEAISEASNMYNSETNEDTSNSDKSLVPIYTVEQFEKIFPSNEENTLYVYQEQKEYEYGGSNTSYELKDNLKLETKNFDIETYEEMLKKIVSDNGHIIEIENGFYWYYDTNKLQWVIRGYEQEETTVTNGIVTVKVGDKITYNPGIETGTTITLTKEETGYDWDEKQTITLKDSGLEWRILGASEGKILITPTDSVTSSNVSLQGQTGYTNGIATLNKIAEYYGKGTGASGARSITVEDVNNVTGYSPETAQYSKGNISEYGNRVTYSWQGTEYPYYEGSNGVTGSLRWSHSSGFTYYDNEWIKVPYASSGEIATIRNTIYSYYPQSLTTSEVATSSGISTSSNEYKMLFKNTSYWLSSQCVFSIEFGVAFGLRCVLYDRYVSGASLFNSFSSEGSKSIGVRPAVSLKSSVQLTGDSSSGWSIVEAE